MLRFGGDWPSHQRPAFTSLLVLHQERRHAEFAQYKARHAQQNHICQDQANWVMQNISTLAREAHRRQYNKQPPLMGVDYLFPGAAEASPRRLR
jgi:hypothetical protein